jgi:23S rRNA (adenine2030-N6)-methyltransferase
VHYHHSYHAGNFADVFKHVLLCGLLSALNRKDAPWFYLETHAGAGLYDLGGAAAARTAEHQDGIGRLWELRDQPPPALHDYFQLIKKQNPEGKLRRYPGSPLFACAFARPGDRLALCEQVPAVAVELKQTLGRDVQAAIHLRDGHEAASLLPPAEKRGLMLIDPPFERRDEFDAIGDLLGEALRRFAQGVYAAWYPLKNRHEAERFLRRQEREGKREALSLKLDTGAPGEGQMRGCGMLVVNPPFGFEAWARETLAFLAPKLAQGSRPGWEVAMLKQNRG